MQIKVVNIGEWFRLSRTYWFSDGLTGKLTLSITGSRAVGEIHTEAETLVMRRTGIFKHSYYLSRGNERMAEGYVRGFRGNIQIQHQKDNFQLSRVSWLSASEYVLAKNGFPIGNMKLDFGFLSLRGAVFEITGAIELEVVAFLLFIYLSDPTD
jgi:hypothetical protein